MLQFQFRNIWREGRGLGLMTFRFKFLSYATGGLLLVIHNLENHFPFRLLDYIVMASLVVMPHVFLYRFVRSGNKIGQLTHDTMYDFFFAGLFAGAMDFSIIPSFVFSLGSTTNYLSVRGFNKLYRLFLLPVGGIVAITINGFQWEFHWASSNLILLLSLSYCVAHYVINAYILYYANARLLQKNLEVEKQQTEISSQAEELRTLNDSLKNLNSDLEAKVLTRTNELEIKNKKLEEYAFINAHKLRAPVATILGLIQLLDYQKSDQDIQEIIDGLKKTSIELDEAIKGIRAKLEEGH